MPMYEGIAVFMLLIVLKDSEAKADIINEGQTTNENRLFMDAWLFGGQPDPDVRRDISPYPNTNAFF